MSHTWSFFIKELIRFSSKSCGRQVDNIGFGLCLHSNKSLGWTPHIDEIVVVLDIICLEERYGKGRKFARDQT